MITAYIVLIRVWVEVVVVVGKCGRSRGRVRVVEVDLNIYIFYIWFSGFGGGATDRRIIFVKYFRRKKGV